MQYQKDTVLSDLVKIPMKYFDVPDEFCGMMRQYRYQ